MSRGRPAPPPVRVAPFLPLLLLLSALASVGSLAAQEPPDPRVLGFEQGSVGEPPARGWVHTTSELGYRAVLTDEESAEGERSALIVYEGEDPPPADAFGNLLQRLDATPYRGQRVRLSAMVRTRGQVFGDRAQLWLRVDRTGGRMGFFDNMHDRPIVGSRWALYEIEGEVADDAETVNLGAMLIGDGRVWIDAVTFQALGAVDLGHEPPRPLTDRGLANLEAFTRLLGYVRFFHPSDEVAEAHWEPFALAGVQAAEEARGPGELARTLEGLFRPLAPTVRVYPTAETIPPPPADLLEPPVGSSSRIVAWRHTGVGLSEGPVYSSERVDLERPTDREPDEVEVEPAEGCRAGPTLEPAECVFEAELGAGVSALVPTALYADAAGTVPRSPEDVQPPVPDKPDGFSPGGTDRTTRLAGVALAWPVFQHFYPYFDVVDVDWDAALRRALRSAGRDPGAEQYLGTLRRMVAALEDGHGYVFHQELGSALQIPVALERVEGRLVIVGVGREAPEPVAPGDVVLEVEGVAAEEALERAEAEVSAAGPGWKEFRALSALVTRGGEDVELLVEGADGEGRRVTLPRTHPVREAIPAEPRPDPIAALEDGIEYVDLTRVTNEELLGIWDRLAAAEGVVFDVRGYPRVGTETLAHLIDEPVSSAQWHVPIVTRPDREGMGFERSGWDVEPVAPRIRGRVAFLTDARAISYAETFLGIVEHYRLGEIVGSPTAGTNGNVNPFELPGGYRVHWTGMKVLKHDGSRHHGVGILPTVPVGRTIEGVREGRDEVLERAVEVLRAGG